MKGDQDEMCENDERLKGLIDDSVTWCRGMSSINDQSRFT